MVKSMLEMRGGVREGNDWVVTPEFSIRLRNNTANTLGSYSELEFLHFQGRCSDFLLETRDTTLPCHLVEIPLRPALASYTKERFVAERSAILLAGSQPELLIGFCGTRQMRPSLDASRYAEATESHANARLIHYPEVPPGVQPIVCKTTRSNTPHPQSSQRQTE
ncbi:hypothetical protein KOW79_017325 [Hemibagrus wyckioides]|uniref:Uncharacterized protein n=1 Tax=Hemibagrus wyckioides TaxID=337641 RepID=A0A9D3N8S9_9TELE|nr:hypothetical protein KOW79_017325 [Hemibagrus wyckioides]